MSLPLCRPEWNACRSGRGSSFALTIQQEICLSQVGAWWGMMSNPPLAINLRRKALSKPYSANACLLAVLPEDSKCASFGVLSDVRSVALTALGCRLVALSLLWRMEWVNGLISRLHTFFIRTRAPFVEGSRMLLQNTHPPWEGRLNCSKWNRVFFMWRTRKLQLRWP